jgi:hypothetical protein
LGPKPDIQQNQHVAHGQVSCHGKNNTITVFFPPYCGINKTISRVAPLLHKDRMPKTKPNPSVKPLSEILHIEPTKTPHKRHVIDPSKKGVGTAIYNDQTWAPVFSQPRVKKQEKGLDTWSNTALILAQRALRASQTYGKKDFNALYRLVLSAGIAYDKAFPQQQTPSGNNLIVQLFGSLGSETAKAILEPAHPLIVVNPPTPQSLPNHLDTEHTSPLDPALNSPT